MILILSSRGVLVIKGHFHRRKSLCHLGCVNEFCSDDMRFVLVELSEGCCLHHQCQHTSQNHRRSGISCQWQAGKLREGQKYRIVFCRVTRGTHMNRKFGEIPRQSACIMWNSYRQFHFYDFWSVYFILNYRVRVVVCVSSQVEISLHKQKWIVTVRRFREERFFRNEFTLLSTRRKRYS
jgi:hypothetical protein